MGSGDFRAAAQRVSILTTKTFASSPKAGRWNFPASRCALTAIFTFQSPKVSSPFGCFSRPVSSRAVTVQVPSGNLEERVA